MRYGVAALLFSLMGCAGTRGFTPGTAAQPRAASVHAERSAATTGSAPDAAAHTVAHEILQAEGAALPTPEGMTKLLDDILLQVRKRAEEARPHLASLAERSRALETLGLVEQVLADEHFAYPARGYVQSLHEALRPTQMDPEAVERLAGAFENSTRESAIRQAPEAIFHIADCDIFSILYVAAGEILGAPIAMVDLPQSPGGSGHNYVRWTLSDGSVINWEAMSGRPRSDSADDHFFSRGPKTRAEASAEHLFGYAMSRDEVIAYGDRLVGGLWGRAGVLDKQLASFRASMTKTSSPVPLNEVVWLLATSSDPALRSPVEAMTLGTRLRERWPSANYLDSVAAAYAAATQWEDSARIEQEAINVAASYDPKGTGFKERLQQIVQHHAYLLPRAEEEQAEEWAEYLQDSIWSGRFDKRCPDAPPPGVKTGSHAALAR